VASYPKTGQAVAKCVGKWPCTRGPAATRHAATPGSSGAGQSRSLSAFIIDLLKRIVTVSLETMKIVDALPALGIIE
jgi:hypothetical protein